VISYKDIAFQILSYSSQADYNCYWVIANFVPNFVGMATGVGREKNEIGSIRWSIPENPLIGATISQKYFTQAKLQPILSQISLPWQPGKISGKIKRHR